MNDPSRAELNALPAPVTTAHPNMAATSSLACALQ
jgi:hypothetical protein